MKKQKTVKGRKSSRGFEICEQCEAHVALGSSACPECGGANFLPEFVHKRKAITKNFSINVVDSFDNPDSRVLNFYKWFPGRRWSLNINSLTDWERIKQIVDEELGPYIGWDTKTKLDQILSSEITTAKQAETNYTESARKIPKFLLEVVSKIDFSKIDKDGRKQVVEGLKALVEIAGKYDKAFQVIFNEVLKKLPKEGKTALVQLEELMGKWSLKQITGVAAIVQERLNDIERLKTAVKNDKTFEIRGENSIHRILENSMWIVDERYWLMHSNETLRTFIGEGLAKKDKRKYGSMRPDFVCGSVDNRLIIMELKRPSHKLIVDDLQQLETYLMVADDYSEKFTSFEAYLVGKRVDSELKRRLKFRKSNFKVLTFADLIDNTEKRYLDYIKLMDVRKK